MSSREHTREDLPMDQDHVEGGHQEQRRPELGVARIEALYRVFGGKRTRWFFYASIGAIVYVWSLDNNTVSSFLVFATSSYGKHSLLGAISVANTILGAIAIPFIAKIADITSRPRAYVFALIFFILGYVLTAGSRNVQTLAVGQLFAQIGGTGISLVNSIIVADITPLKWRGWGNALISAPYIVNAFISAGVVDGILARGEGMWRWGYGIFVILLPSVMTPALIVLFWAELKAKREGMLSISDSGLTERSKNDAKSRTALQAFKDYFAAVDLIGLLLLAAAFALLLLPFTLYATMENGWRNKGIIAMFVLGGVCLFSFVAWEFKFAKKPMMRRSLLNRTLVLAILIDFFYFLGGYLRLLYFSSWVWVVKDYNYSQWTLFNNAMGVGLCVFGLVAGLITRVTRRYKMMQICGQGIMVVGYGLTLHSRKVGTSDAELVWTQLLIAIGGACSVVGSIVAAQASVKHEDMATAMALQNLWTNLGGSIGSAISTAVWTGRLPGYLEKHLPNVSAEERAAIFGSIDVARNTEPAVRAGVIAAYNDTVYLLWLPALCISVLPMLCTCFMDNYRLGDTHNAVENTTVTGETIPVPVDKKDSEELEPRGGSGSGKSTPE